MRLYRVFILHLVRDRSTLLATECVETRSFAERFSTRVAVVRARLCKACRLQLRQHKGMPRVRYT
ncbi:hypothetical protein C0J52_14873 [Blattella germanica]|nr:hypothetical protein C0J52_14873 [Blattella germanica]